MYFLKADITIRQNVFGKKYLWLALYKADALLSDHLKVVDGSRYVYSPQKKT